MRPSRYCFGWLSHLLFDTLNGWWLIERHDDDLLIIWVPCSGPVCILLSFFFLFINWWCLAFFFDCVCAMTSSSVCDTQHLHNLPLWPPTTPLTSASTTWKTRSNHQKDYSEEFRDIGGVKGKGKAQLPEGAITLINQRIVTDDLPVISFYPQTNTNLETHTKSP